MDNDAFNLSGADRRKYPRLNAAVTYSVVDRNSGFQDTRNISAGGIAFFSGEQIEIGCVIYLRIILPDSSLIRAKAKVVWTQAAHTSWKDNAGYEFGVEFSELSEDDRRKISRFVVLRLDKDL